MTLSYTATALRSIIHQQQDGIREHQYDAEVVPCVLRPRRRHQFYTEIVIPKVQMLVLSTDESNVR